MQWSEEMQNRYFRSREKDAEDGEDEATMPEAMGQPICFFHCGP
jgi:hypothetical protein